MTDPCTKHAVKVLEYFCVGIGSFKEYFFSILLLLFSLSTFYFFFFSTKGIEQFQQALKISPHNASAHYGLASALLGLAKECVNLGAFKWGASLLEVSVTK